MEHSLWKEFSNHLFGKKNVAQKKTLLSVNAVN